MRRGPRVCQYIVIRQHDLLGYVEYLGPMVSVPSSVWSDANRLFGKPGHTITWVSLSKATPQQKRECKAE